MTHCLSYGRAVVISSMAAALLSLAACTHHAAGSGGAAIRGSGNSGAAASGGWNSFTGRFIEDYFKAHPFFAAQSGRHEFDGQMGDWSAAGLQAEIARLRVQRAAAASFADAGLTSGQRFERDYLLSVIDGELFWMEQARFPFTNPAWYIDRMDPELYVSRPYAPLAKRLAGYIGYARAIPRIAADIRANLRTPLAKPLLERGIDGFSGFATFFRDDVPKVFAAVQDPAVQKELADVNAAAARAMDELTAWLVSQRAGATDSFELGAPRFSLMLQQTEAVNVSLADLKAVGEADMERNERALAAACAQLLPKGTIQACADKENADKPQGGVVDAARAQLTQLKAFVTAKQVVTIPGSEEALVAEAPPYMRGNFAYINIPGPYDNAVPSTYNISPPDPRWSPAERAAYIPGKASLLFTSVHEVWPGHFLQFLHANRNPSKIAALWVGNGYAEGWAHYCEEMMWEEGLGAGDPEVHVGQILEALLRDARFLSAIGLHTEGMTLAQSETMFRERAHADPGNARQQAARGTYDPSYLIYTMDKLMIRKLRSDWVAAHLAPGADPKSEWPAFHDQFLSYGGPPVPLVRKAMVGDTGTLF